MIHHIWQLLPLSTVFKNLLNGSMRSAVPYCIHEFNHFKKKPKNNSGKIPGSEFAHVKIGGIQTPRSKISVTFLVCVTCGTSWLTKSCVIERCASSTELFQLASRWMSLACCIHSRLLFIEVFENSKIPPGGNCYGNFRWFKDLSSIIISTRCNELLTPLESRFFRNKIKAMKGLTNIL